MDVELNGETLLYPIAGDPIAQVKSPGLLTGILVERGKNALVVPAHVHPDDYATFVATMKTLPNVDGLIATVPHKQATLGYCDHPTERAAFAGSVNVMHKRADGTWQGDNTDGQGYLNGVADCGFDIAGKRALLVGVGGAGAAIAYEILARGAAYLAIHDVDSARRDATIARLEDRFPGKVGVGSADPTGYDFVGNATPVGMREGDPLPIDAHKYESHQFVADSITKPTITPQLEIAQSKGCAIMPGLGMFNAQAELLVDVMTGNS
ncbi:shikimate dehydrogenase family protein [Celeribacter litoreus]|uniref:shikimate dehydrogenase family protein n=1 Tax=Celeribacter litoreus TaxID=2876714 RepID=UPI001CCA6CA3|nr:shikimate dehydrogenase [Celeribacter litoreus]MCA0044884.1 shikimate dehydrogenase [Celeribacter litoreus]